MLIFFHLVVLVQLFIKKKKKRFTTDINEFSQLEMALQLPLNETSQPNLSYQEKELVVAIISKNINYYSITYIAPYNTNFERTRDTL